jgi:hypothetical protein
MPFIATDLVIAAVVFAGLMVALEVGFRAGSRVRLGAEKAAAPQVGAIQGAILGLLGLLLAFSFSAAASRFLERQDLIVDEANAIGTAYLRADLLVEPHRADLKRALKEYTEHRIEVSQRLGSGLDPADLAQVDAMHGRIWRAAVSGVEATPTAMLGVLPPVNEVLDLHSTRLGAGAKKLPSIVLWLLFGSSWLSIAVIGYGCGVAHDRRAPLTLALTVLVGGLLFVTLDLDRPREGLLQLSDQPLRALKFDEN